MSVFAWCTRRVGGLSFIALIVLCYWVIASEFESKSGTAATAGIHNHGKPEGSFKGPGGQGNAGRWTVFWAYYSVLIHTLVFMFPMRACWAVEDLTRSLRKVARNKQLRDFKFSHQRRLSQTSLSSAETLTSQSSSSSSEAGDIELSYYTDADIEQEKIIHAIIIPNYKEDIDGLRETLDVLACHPQARYTYDVYLGMEARETNVELKAMSLVSEFVKKFRFIDFTLHPGDIPGEAAGKGSNMAWAARKASERYSGAQRKDVIITGIDADSHLSSNYFALISTMHLAYPETATTTLYSAPIIFDRNAHLVPAIVRVADVLWCAAGLSGLYQTSTIRPPTSVYSIPLELADRVGGWDADPEAIGEDLHMYLKCFFALNGHLTTRTVLAPVSQTNVSSGGKGLRGYINDCRSRYKQAMRHMWGALDSGFALRMLADLWRERKSTQKSFRPLHTSSSNDDGHVYTPQLDNLLLEEPSIENGVFSDIVHDTLKSPDYFRIFYLFHRLFEAHFLPIHMAILIISSTIYLWVTAGKPDTLELAWTFELCNYLRIMGMVAIGCYMFIYERYHKICVSAREAEMKAAGLDQGMTFSKRSFRKNFLDYFIFPIVAPAYGSIPAAVAQICHFWTLELVYAVSKKPTRQRAKSAVGAAKAVLADIMA